MLCRPGLRGRYLVCAVQARAEGKHPNIDQAQLAQGKKCAKSFRNHCVIEQKITQKAHASIDFQVFSVQSRNDSLEMI